MAVLQDFARWQWRLIPANPILVRVVHGASRRTRHLYIRGAYLLVLLGVMLLAKLVLQQGGPQSLDDLARSNCQVFMWISRVQLAMICLIAPVFAAGAITQERDAQTYNILLSTPLTNAQIVLGSLLSRLYFVLVLLLSGLPIFCITMLYGGVTRDQILLSSALAGCTAVVTAALAIAMSLIKTGSRQTMFSFYGIVGFYLAVVYGLSLLGSFQVPQAPPNLDTGLRMSWLAAFHPFLALEVVFNATPPPDPAAVAHYGWPARYLLAYPYFGYQVVTLLAAAVLVAISIFFARGATWEGELRWWWRVRALLVRQLPGERRRQPRHVWKNPVAWREAVTRATASGRTLVRTAFVLAGLVAGGWLFYLYLTSPATNAASVRVWLARLIFGELAIILLMACNAAAAAITRERESNSLDLLICTPLSSRYVVRGKLRGLVSFLAPMLAVPTITLLAFAAADLRQGPVGRIVQPETPFFLAAIMLLFAAVVCILGVQVSLKARKTVQAMIHALGLVLLGGVLLSGCGEYLCQEEGLGSFAASFTPYTAVMVPLNPGRVTGVDVQAWTPPMIGRIRAYVVVGGVMAIAAYTLLLWALYRSIIHNYDMTIRKQSAEG